LSTSTDPAHNKFSYLSVITIAALGVVYGDIGTSPLYSVKECFHGSHGLAPSHANILGILSLIFWSLIIVVSIKYIIVVMRADNDGEGGILALMELVRPSKKTGMAFTLIIAMGLFGASLLYGDGIITPAISVLSAIEGLNVATTFFEPYIIPLTVGILIILFIMQKRGTGGIGMIFGPIMAVWFLTIAILGITSIIKFPVVFKALDPSYAYSFFLENGFHGFVILGSVFLVVTGGEALYADMGHFGTKPIRIAWFSLVLPSLVLNYFGQGAVLLNNPAAIENPFYYLAPHWALYPMVILSTCATVIASQAIISGAFSLTLQAIQLGYLPRLTIRHTSQEERGQIYIPSINWMLFISTVALVLNFKTSSNLAGAYGIAVTTTMVITAILAFTAMRKLWHWSIFISILITIFFLSVDLSFWGANLLKIANGGYVPLAMGLGIYLLMSTWNWGRKLLFSNLQKETLPIENSIMEFLSIRLVTIQGTAIYMSSNAYGTPPALIHNIKHNKILHKQVIILTILFDKVPHLNLEKRIEISSPTEGFYKVIAHYGFMDNANIMDIIEILNKNGLKLKLDHTTFFLGRERLSIKHKGGLLDWRKKLFIAMSYNAQRATEFFNIPANRVFEIGTQVEL
jgi:KUP system potassium uptake protein